MVMFFLICNRELGTLCYCASEVQLNEENLLRMSTETSMTYYIPISVFVLLVDVHSKSA